MGLSVEQPAFSSLPISSELQPETEIISLQDMKNILEKIEGKEPALSSLLSSLRLSIESLEENELSEITQTGVLANAYWDGIIALSKEIKALSGYFERGNSDGLAKVTSIDVAEVNKQIGKCFEAIATCCDALSARKIDQAAKKTLPHEEPFGREIIPRQDVIQEKTLTEKALDLNKKKVKLVRFAEGKVKNVEEFVGESSLVILTPKVSVLGLAGIKKTPEQEMRDEYEISKEIQEKVPSSENVMRFEEVPGGIDGKYALVSERGEDLGKYIQQELSLDQRFGCVLGYFQGVRDLHAAGYCHGDQKKDNALCCKKKQDSSSEPIKESSEKGETESKSETVSEGTSDVTVKISDFGKTRKLNQGERVSYFGNPRYEPPEGGLSFEGDVFSASEVAICILDEALIGKKGDSLVPLEPKECKDSSPEAMKRRGFEQFLVRNKKCTASESSHIRGRIRMLSMRSKSSIPQEIIEDSVKEVHRYIDAQVLGLKEKYPEEAEKIDSIGLILKQMTSADPRQRPNMNGVVDTMKKVIYGQSKVGPEKEPSPGPQLD